MPMTAITRITVDTEVTTTGVDALACKGTLGLGGTELGRFPDDWDEGESGEEGLEEDEEVEGFEEWSQLAILNSIEPVFISMRNKSLRPRKLPLMICTAMFQSHSCIFRKF